MKTLKKFLKKHNACQDGFEFAKNLTLEQFLNTCERGDWILWLFKKVNPDSLRELTLAKALCANSIRHLMKDERSIKAVDVAIAFGEGRASKKELDDAAYAAAVAYAAATVAYTAYAAAAHAATAAYAAAAHTADSDAAYAAYAAYAVAYADARNKNQKETADICRKYLPLEIWDQSKL